MHGERATTAERPEDRRMAYLPGGDVERSQLPLELLGVLDVGQQVGDRDQLAVLQQPADEAGVVVPPLLPVGEDVDPGPQLCLDGQAYGVVRRLGELLVADPRLEVLVQRAHASGPSRRR